MATEKNLIDREKEVTDKISIQVRTISIGILVFAWGIFSAAENTVADKIKKSSGAFVLLVSIFAIA